MKATQKLHDAGQSLWLDHITRGLVQSGGLAGYIRELSITGLTSNPTIFARAIEKGAEYDGDIGSLAAAGKDTESIFFELAIRDLSRAADLFQPIHDATNGVDGWVSLEVSPRLAYDTAGTIAAAKQLWAQAARPKLFIKIPGTQEGIPAIEEAIFAGIPINVTLLFSAAQYQAAAEAYLRGVERRLSAGRNPLVASVASLFVSRWDGAVAAKVPDALRGRLGIAIGHRTYKLYRDLLDSDRWLRLLNRGARAQRLLWASTGTKDPRDPDMLYVHALVAPHTVNTLPEPTLLALADHGEIGALLPRAAEDAEELLGQFAHEGIDVDKLAVDLQRQGAAAFVDSWDALLASISKKGAALRKTP